MGAYKPPSFQDRSALAAKAKLSAIENHYAKAAIDRNGAEKPISSRNSRETARKLRQEKHKQAHNLEKVEKDRKAAELRDLEAVFIEPSEFEKALARNARYTARNRK